MPSQTQSRKQEHVELCVDQDVTFRTVASGFDEFQFKHQALPELDFKDVDPSSSFLGRPLRAPLIISSMTGGYPDAERINRSLGEAAELFGLGIGIGSGRQALEDRSQIRSFQAVRAGAKTSPVFANIGAVELAALHRTSQLARVHELIEITASDAVAVHLNPVQELMQPEGSPNFSGVLAAIEALVKSISTPVIVKEVGAGISHDVAARVLDVGVRVIDVAGAGGTSWAGVEILRHDPSAQQRLEPFWDWGITTLDAILEVRDLKESHTFTLIASGGIRHGIDIAKCIALGADLGAMARPLLQSLTNGGEAALHAHLEQIIFQLKGAMFLTGSRTLSDLREQKLFV